jgi:hypothetical protein
MTTHQKIVLIEKYRMVLATMTDDLLTYFQVNGLKKTQLMNYLRDKNPSSKEMTNVAFYEKIKGPTRWKYEEIVLALEFINATEKKETVIAFYQLINEVVNKDIDKSPFQFKFFTNFFEEHFGLTYASVYYQPIRWRYNLDELLELYRLIEHVEKFKLLNGTPLLA